MPFNFIRKVTTFSFILLSNIAYSDNKDSDKSLHILPAFILKQRKIGLQNLSSESLKKLTPEDRAALEKPSVQSAIRESLGRQTPEIGYDLQRIQAGTGELVQPKALVFTFSATNTLEEFLILLKQKGLAHSYYIDRNGTIYQSCTENEFPEEAEKHRLFAVGKSYWSFNGGRSVSCDLNSHSFSIALIGKNENGQTPEQIKAQYHLARYLMEKYNISPAHILTYGEIAIGRRNVDTNLQLNSIGLSPKPEHKINPTLLDPNLDFYSNEKNKSIWLALVLHKYGMNVPLTNNSKDPDLIAAIIAFQKRYHCDNQEGIITNNTLDVAHSILIQLEKFHPDLKNIQPNPYTTTKDHQAS